MPAVQVTYAPCIEIQSDLLAETCQRYFQAVPLRPVPKLNVTCRKLVLMTLFFSDILGSDLVPESVEGVKTTPRLPVCFDLVTDKLISREALIDAQKK